MLTQPGRLNIHLTLDTQTEAYVSELNRRIRQVTPSDIVFSKTSPMRPHITLAMGYRAPEITESQLLSAIDKTLRRLAKGLAAPLQMRLRRPRLVASGYVLCDVAPTENLLRLRRDILAELSPRWLSRATVGTDPHVSIGYIRRRRVAVVRLLRQPLTRYTSLVITPSFEISHVGPRGSSIDSLAEIALSRGDGSFRSSA